MVEGLKVTGDKKAAAAQIRALYKLFVDSDCTMVEVNPLAEGLDGTLIAADAKLGFDDNAAYRQKEIFAMRDECVAAPPPPPRPAPPTLLLLPLLLLGQTNALPLQNNQQHPKPTPHK